MAKCCLFMPFQKAIGGISGYFVASFTPHALALIEKNQKDPVLGHPAPAEDRRAGRSEACRSPASAP